VVARSRLRLKIENACRCVEKRIFSSDSDAMENKELCDGELVRGRNKHTRTAYRGADELKENGFEGSEGLFQILASSLADHPLTVSSLKSGSPVAATSSRANSSMR
jgi:hypothetical protein